MILFSIENERVAWNMILEIEDKSKLPISLEIIQKSFATVADEFHLTKENCPGHTAFMALNKLQNSFKSGNFAKKSTISSE